MPEIEKSISFNAFHILLIVLISNIIINNNYESIKNVINYVLSMETPGFWFLMLHIVIAYIMLTALKIELGFHAAIKLNL
jgi:hypothetical protein